MKVLLVWPTGMRGAALTDHCVFPLGLGYVLNAARAVPGVEVAVLDASLDRLGPADVAARLDGADVVAVSCWGFNLQNVHDTIAAVRAAGDAVVVAGGPSAHLAGADHSIVGEGELAFAALLGALRDDLRAPAGVPGVQRPGEPVAFPTCFTADLDTFGLVDYAALRLDDYLEAGYKDWMYTLKDKFRAAPLMVTRGCPYSCGYCQGPLVMGRRIRRHSPAYVIETMCGLHERHGIRQFGILDDNFTFDVDFAKSVCAEIIRLRERTGWRFAMTTVNGVRVGRLDDELLAMMKRAGWNEIVISPESGSPRTLRRMRKRMDLDDVVRKIGMVHRQGMTIVGNFMCGYPGETREDLELTRRFMVDNDFDRCNVSIFNPIPGTPIHEELLASGEIDGAPRKIDYKAIGYLTPTLERGDLLGFIEAVRCRTQFRERWIRDLAAC